MPFDIMELVQEAQNNKYKIKNIVIKDGKFEDTLNIYDTLTEDEQKLYGSRNRKESEYLIFRKVAYTKDTGIPVGYIQLDDSSKIYNDPTLKDVNIGIIIRKEFRGSGLSVILIKEAIKWFKTTDIETMSYITRYGNEASERLAKKCGFVFFRDNKELKEKVFLITNPSLLKSINESAILDPVLKNIVLEAKKDDGISAGDDPNKKDKDDDKSDYSPDDNVGEDEDEGTDYTADENIGEDEDSDTTTDDDAGTDEDTTDDTTDTDNEDEGTDYTADENVGEDENADEGDASGDDAGTGEDEGETTDDSGEGTDETTDDQESDSTESDNGLGGDDEESIANQEKVRNVLLLRSFIKIYKQIQIFSQKISESRRNNILTIVASSQVLDNLKKLEGVVYKYIIMSYDNNTYEVNLYNFNYFLEVMRLNLEMIRKANESSEQEEDRKEHKKSSTKDKKVTKKKTKEYSPYTDKKKDKKEETKIDFKKLKSGLNYNTNESYILNESNSIYSTRPNFIFSENDIYCNTDKFKKDCNILFVTGFSGSGKSTLAKRFAVNTESIYVELDALIYRGRRAPFTKEWCYDNRAEILWMYIQEKKKSPDFMTKYNHRLDIDKELIQECIDYIEWLETRPTHPNTYVIEGIDLVRIIPANPKWFLYPIIFKGTSMLTSMIRKIKRDGIKKLSIEYIKELFSWYSTMYSDQSGLRSATIFKDNHFEKSDNWINT